MEEVLKFIAIGDSGVGKSCLLLRFCDNQFEPSFTSTLGIDFKIRTVALANGRRVRLQIWDTAGQDRFRSITSAYYRGAQVALVVFALDNRESFNSCNHWIVEARRCAGPDIVIALLGNKCDAQDGRTVSAQTAASWASAQNVAYYEVSAKSGERVTECICELAERVLAAATERLTQPSPAVLPEQNKCQCLI